MVSAPAAAPVAAPSKPPAMQLTVPLLLATKLSTVAQLLVPRLMAMASAVMRKVRELLEGSGRDKGLLLMLATSIQAALSTACIWRSSLNIYCKIL